jgi:hypothetical protein
MRGSDESGKKVSDPCGSQGTACLMEPFRCEKRAIEIDTPKPIHLEIEKTWTEVKLRPTEITGRSFLIRFHLDDLPVLNDDVHWRFCPGYFPLNDHDDLSVELYRKTNGFKIF